MTPQEKKQMVEVQDTYNKEGFLIKRTANGIPLFVPKEITPRVQIINLDTEWVMKKQFMTKKEFNETYKNITL